MLVATSDETTFRVCSPKELQVLYQHQLRRLLRLKRMHTKDLSKVGNKILDWAIFGAFCELSAVVGRVGATIFLEREKVVISELLRAEQAKEESSEEESSREIGCVIVIKDG